MVAFTCLMIFLSIYISYNPDVLSGGGFGDPDGLIYCMLGLGGFFGLIGGNFFASRLSDTTFTVAIILHQGDVAGADIGTGAALNAVKQTVLC